MKKKIYVLTFVDLVNCGYQTKRVYVFNDKEDAISHMTNCYLEMCKEEEITEPYNAGLDNQITDDFAFIYEKYYWDIFEETISV